MDKIGIYKNSLELSEIREFESVGGDLLRLLGYN